MAGESQINLFTPFYRVDECLSAIKDCLERGWTGLGYKTVEFEEAWKAYTGLPHAHFLNSCTAALHLAVALLKRRRGWKDGDEIVTSPLTFVSTNHSILYERLRPVFADVDEHLCLDPASVAERVGPRTRAVMFVGYAGNVGGLEAIRRLCAERGLALILDAAHMAGTRIGGVHAGHGMDAVAFSFHSVKNLPTADGGMLCFSDPELDALARKLSWLGIDKDTFSRTQQQGSYKWMYDIEGVGWKYHGNSIMASIGMVSLRYLDQDNAYRRQIASWYDALLPGLHLERPPIPNGCEPSRHIYPVMVDRRDDLIVFLNAAQIFPGVHYRSNTDYPMYAEWKGKCPRAERASERLISLPIHLKLSRRDVEKVASWIADFVRRKGLA